MDYTTEQVAARLHAAFGDQISDDRFAEIVDLIVEEIRQTAEESLLANGLG